MERRFYLGVGLLVLLLIAGLFGAWVIKNAQAPIAKELDKAALAAVEGDLDSGILLAKHAKNAWQNRWRAVAAVADHTPMDDIDALFAELEVYARAGEDVHFAACCSQLASLLRTVAQAHQLSWWNVM